jgi:transposase
VPRVAPDIELDSHTQKELSRLARAPSTTQAVALRARIILAAAQRRSNQEIAATLGITANTVTRWRQRFLMFGVDGLTDWGHGGRPRKYGDDVQQRLRRLLHRPPPGGAARWTLDELSRQLEVPRSTVHEMLTADRFQRRRGPAGRSPR